MPCRLQPKPVALTAGILLMVIFVAWSFALTYTVSAKVFGVPVVQSVLSVKR